MGSSHSDSSKAIPAFSACSLLLLCTSLGTLKYKTPIRPMNSRRGDVLPHDLLVDEGCVEAR